MIRPGGGRRRSARWSTLPFAAPCAAIIAPLRRRRSRGGSVCGEFMPGFSESGDGLVAAGQCRNLVFAAWALCFRRGAGACPRAPGGVCPVSYRRLQSRDRGLSAQPVAAQLAGLSAASAASYLVRDPKRQGPPQLVAPATQGG